MNELLMLALRESPYILQRRWITSAPVSWSSGHLPQILTKGEAGTWILCSGKSDPEATKMEAFDTRNPVHKAYEQGPESKMSTGGLNEWASVPCWGSRAGLLSHSQGKTTQLPLHFDGQLHVCKCQVSNHFIVCHTETGWKQTPQRCKKTPHLKQ